MTAPTDGYTTAFRRALNTLRAIEGNDPDWWPKDQPSTTAFSWAIGLELSPEGTRWIYSCWGSRPDLKAAVLDAPKYGVRHCTPGGKDLPGERGRGRLFYPRQYLVDFSTYPLRGNAMLLGMESEAYADHPVGSSEIDPAHDYNWDFAKLLYLPAQIRVFVARVRGASRRAQLWEDLAAILSSGSDAFSLEHPIIVYLLATNQKGENSVGLWRKDRFLRASLGTWRTEHGVE